MEMRCLQRGRRSDQGKDGNKTERIPYPGASGGNHRMELKSSRNRDGHQMEYKFSYCDEFLVIQLSGKVKVNDRLAVKELINPHLIETGQKVIIDMGALEENGGIYLLGVLNTIKKEFEIFGGEVKLCSLKPEISRFLEENRLDQVFDIAQSVEQAKQRFRSKSNGN